MARYSAIRQRGHSPERGQAATEFVILVPALIAVVVAIVAIFRLAYAQLATTTAAYDCNMLSLQQTTRDTHWAEQRGNAALEYAKASHLMSGWSDREMSVHWASGCQVGFDTDEILGLGPEELSRETEGGVQLYRSCWDTGAAIAPIDAVGPSGPTDPNGRTCNFVELPSDVN